MDTKFESAQLHARIADLEQQVLEWQARHAGVSDALDLFARQFANASARAERLDAMLVERLRRCAHVEDVLLAVAAGKRRPLSPDECRALAMRLGAPEIWGDKRGET